MQNFGPKFAEMLGASGGFASLPLTGYALRALAILNHIFWTGKFSILAKTLLGTLLPLSTDKESDRPVISSSRKVVRHIFPLPHVVFVYCQGNNVVFFHLE